MHAAHQEALKREIERLRQVYHQQNMKKMENAAAAPAPPPPTTAAGAADAKLPPAGVDQTEQGVLNVVV